MPKIQQSNTGTWPLRGLKGPVPANNIRITTTSWKCIHSPGEWRRIFDIDYQGPVCMSDFHDILDTFCPDTGRPRRAGDYAYRFIGLHGQREIVGCFTGTHWVHYLKPWDEQDYLALENAERAAGHQVLGAGYAQGFVTIKAAEEATQEAEAWKAGVSDVAIDQFLQDIADGKVPSGEEDGVGHSSNA